MSPSVPAWGEELPKTEDSVIAKARAATTLFLEHLPNYVCQESITRYTATSARSRWNQQDYVTADLAYEEGREHYRNVAINGVPTRKPIEELPGNWSIGEFATDLVGVFSPVTGAEFRFREDRRLGARDALIYDYFVRPDRSEWYIQTGANVLTPAYRGSIWIDRQTSRVLRVEKRADQLPASFPWETLEASTQFGSVRLGNEEFLLPVRSETIGCQRRANHCVRNLMEFRNYHKFTGESTVSFGP